MAVERKILAAAVRILAGVIDRKSYVPVLGGVLVVDDGSGLELVGSDLDVTMRVRLPAAGSGEWVAALVDPSTLAGVAKVKGPALDVRHAFDGGALQLGAARVPTLGNVCDYPEVRDGSAIADGWIDAGGLVQAFGHVGHCMSEDETRYFLNGIYLDPEEPLVVATDGHRLAVAPSGWEGARDVIIPRKLVAAVERAMAKGATVRAVIAAGVVAFEVRRADGLLVHVAARAVDGEFPEWRRVVPRGEGIAETRVDAVSVVAAVAELAPFYGRRSNGTRVTVNKKMRLSTTHPDLGSHAVSVATLNKIPKIKLGINGRYLREAFGAFTGEVAFRVKDPLDPVMVAAGERFEVVMPMRL